MLGFQRHEAPFSTYPNPNHRPLTPPPDMSGLLDPTTSGSHYTNSYGPYTALTAAYPSTTTTFRTSEEQGVIDRAASPGLNARSLTFPASSIQPGCFERRSAGRAATFEKAGYDRPQVQSKQAHAAIAPSFQIPRTVNDSGGSLSDLAAHITCLFWFESSELLKQIEHTPASIVPTRPLAADATPTSGFRKWVTTILSTTLVDANVVLLALLFIHRLKTLNPTVKGTPGSEFRLLTVALMLGNKFLDDNTYTNKTWAEVSGINVNEVHIMEVEFLSNMKYCLYTSLEQWNEWQQLLGCYAAYVKKAQNPVMTTRATIPVPILPPASTLRLPSSLPSPPASQHSPPYAIDRPSVLLPSMITPVAMTPAPSPLTAYPVVQEGSRKRSRDDGASEPAAKRFASAMQNGHRLTVPTLPPPTMPSTLPGLPAMSAAPIHHLPPISVPARAMSLVYPGNIPSQASSRQTSPRRYAGEATAQDLPLQAPPMRALETSPSQYLHQRSSPYRPVHNVSTLLYPSPAAALHSRRPSIEYSQMHYQPLGKVTQVHTGRLPVLQPSDWLDGLGRTWNMPAMAVPARQHPLSYQRT